MNGTRKSSLSGKITVLFVICCFCFPVWGKYGGGSGTPEDPYLIYDANQMNAIGADSDDWDKCFKLMADIDLSAFTGTSFNIIGASWDNVFTGVFDGNGHTISNFTYTSTDRRYIGLFGYVSGANAEIENLGLIAPDVNAGTGSDVGSVAGYLKEGTMSSCYVEGGSISGRNCVGGLVGDSSGEITNCYSVGSVSGYECVGGLLGGNSGTITNCYSIGDVSGDRIVGGLVGRHVNGIITSCCSTSFVSGTKWEFGGLVGENRSTITNCYSTGGVSGDFYAGGLVGCNYGRITNCYSTGTVSGDADTGGLVAGNFQGTVTASFWDFQTSGPSTSDGGIGLTTAEMQTKSTFMAWGCGSVWTIDEGVDYPRLFWENAPGEPIPTPSYGGGSGEPNDPYLIYTAEQLNTIGLVPCHLDKHFKLMADIELDTLPPPPPSPSIFKASNPNPAHGAFGVSLTADLSWTPGLGAKSHDVYFGTSSIPPFVCNQTSTTFDPGTMSFGMKYYWHIDEVNDSVVTAGEIWNFKTPMPPPTPLPLMADVDLGQFDGGDERENFNIIGYYLADPLEQHPFTGVFDGNGHTISNFTYTSTDRDYIGLFGFVDGALIKNLGVINPNIYAESGNYFGGMVGFLSNGTITNSYVDGGSIAGSNYVGGILGANKGTIDGCNSSANVEGSRYVGGLVGGNTCTITNCYSGSNVSGEDYVGGLAGENRFTITNCYATGSVIGTEDVGGLVGCNWYSGTITNCYATGRITGGYRYYTGGLFGSNTGNVIACFWDIETSGQDTSHGGTGLTTAEMQMFRTFIDWGGCGNEGIWTLDEGNDYPHLWWEEKPGEPLPVYQLSDFIAGAGTQIDPYLIYTAEQLNMIGLVSCDWDKHFKLMADIDLSNFTVTSFNIIGGSWRPPFSGVFDGNGKKIFNFTYTSNEQSYIGLFGSIDGENAVIKDLGLIDVNINSGTSVYVGSLVGRLYCGTITGCYVEGGSVEGDCYVGGLAGGNACIITNCYATGSVFGDCYVGGLVGYNNNSIVDCYTSGNVTGSNNSYCVGGLCGKSTGPDHGLVQSSIQNCYSTATVTGYELTGGLIGHSGAIVTGCYSRGSVGGDNYVGGLIGRNGGHGSIINCYSTGSIVGEQSLGGLVGRSDGTVSASFWDIETSGQYSSDGGTGLPTAQMQMMSTFTNVGWDFVGETANGTDDIWFIPEGDYPHLWWERMEVPMKLTPGTLNCRSRGGWVKAHFVLPADLTVEDVDSNILGWIDSPRVEADYMDVFVDEGGFVRVDMAFDRAALCEKLTMRGSVELTVRGFLTNGHYFYGTETITIK